MSLSEIVRALGGDLYDGDTRANVPGPGHRPDDRSVSLLYENGRIVAHCFGKGDWREVLDDLRARGLIDAENRPTGRAATPAVRVTRAVASRLDRIEAARRIWDLGGPIQRTLAETYLRRRAITRTLPGPDVARFVLEAPVFAYGGRGPTRPALVVAISDRDGHLSGVEINYLAPNGRRAQDLRLPRKTVGSAPASSAVRIDAPADHMVVAEGFPTTLSASERFDLPGWALLSTRNLRSWIAPLGVRSVLVAGDRGVDGEASANLLCQRLTQQGVAAEPVFPETPDGDWNDVAVAAARRGAPRLL